MFDFGLSTEGIRRRVYKYTQTTQDPKPSRDGRVPFVCFPSSAVMTFRRRGPDYNNNQPRPGLQTKTDICGRRATAVRVYVTTGDVWDDDGIEVREHIKTIGRKTGARFTNENYYRFFERSAGEIRTRWQRLKYKRVTRSILNFVSLWGALSPDPPRCI